MDFDIGSNQFKNASNGIEIDGMGQFSFEYNRRHNEIMMRGLIFDRNGSLVAKIIESTLDLNIRGEFELVTEAAVVKLIRRDTREVLLELKFTDKDRVQIHQAKLFTCKGRPFEVAPKSWKIGENSHSGEYQDCAGGPVQLI